MYDVLPIITLNYNNVLDFSKLLIDYKFHQKCLKIIQWKTSNSNLMFILTSFKLKFEKN